MKITFPLIGVMLLVASCSRPNTNSTSELSREEVNAMMDGDYDLIGRKPDSMITYSGRVTLRAEGTNLLFVRTINGRTQKGKVIFTTIGGEDHIPVMQMRFVLDEVEYQASYQWRCDPDNYYRFTGVVYLPEDRTKSRGLESLFHSSK